MRIRSFTPALFALPFAAVALAGCSGSATVDHDSNGGGTVTNPAPAHGSADPGSGNAGGAGTGATSGHDGGTVDGGSTSLDGGGGIVTDGGAGTPPADGAVPGVPLPSTKAFSALSADDIGELCDWTAAQLGGYGRVHMCGSAPITAPADKTTCVTDVKAVAAAPTCAATVGDWAAVTTAAATCSKDPALLPIWTRVATCQTRGAAPSGGGTTTGPVGSGGGVGGGTSTASCHGYRSCSSAFSSFACGEILGCSYTSGYCSGIPVDQCSDMHDEFQCTATSDCSWY